MTDGALRIEVACDHRVYYAMQQNAVPLVQQVRLWNETDRDLHDLEVTLRLEPELSPPWTARVATVPAGTTFNLTTVDLQLRPEILANATERQCAVLRAEVHTGGQLLASADESLEVLAYNEWPGTGSLPAVLAAFVLPNHPALVPILQDTARRLQAETGRASLDGYQSRDPRRARAIAQAIFEAIAARRLTYINPPASFEEHGQKVRTPEQTLAEGMGTCLDLAVLFAACLEQVRLHPLLVLVEGHALCGLWCVGNTFPDAAVEDPLPLRKRVELGDMALVECTQLCSTAPSFGEALAEGARHVAPDAQFLHAVDVTAARRLGFRPLPARTAAYATAGPVPQTLPGADEAGIATALRPDAEPPDGEVPARDARLPDDEVSSPDAASPTEVPRSAPLPSAEPPPAEAPPAQPENRMQRWRRRLLDLSLRNRLLNFRPTKKTLPLLAPDLAQWEDALQSGRTFAMLPAPKVGGEGDPRDLEQARRSTGTDLSLEFLRQELDEGRLRTSLAEEEMERRLLEMFRTARVSLEETGANTLFLAFGFLEWFETPTAGQGRLAPLLLLPVEIERISVAGGYRVRLVDEDMRLNQTLVQKLRDDFQIEVPGLDELPEDESGIDVTAVLEAFRRAVVEVDRWQVVTQAWLGFFSFTKHLMWLDLGERQEDLMQSSLLRHLVESPERAYAADAVFPVPRELDQRDPAELFCPKDADSSQLCAVLSGAALHDFVLEGPPGTGKSQTITNLIAQCLAEGRRVLFVAEKSAALQVVQRRLEEVGLGPFCLELHSHRGHKREVVLQLGRALEAGRTREPAAWARRAAELQRSRTRLNAHAAALHRPREIGETVFQVVAALIGARDVPLVEGLPTDVDREGRAAMAEAVAALAAAAVPLGVPDRHVFRGVGIADWHPALPRDLAPVFERLQRAADELRSRVESIAGVLGLPHLAGEAGASRAQLAELDELCDLLLEGPVAESLCVGADAAALREAVSRWVVSGRRMTGLLAELQGRFRPELLDVDLSVVRQRYERWGGTIWILRVFGLRKAKGILRRVAAGGRVPAPAQVLRDLEAAAEAKGERARLAAAGPDARACLGPRWQGNDTDWNELDAMAERAGRLRQLAVGLGPDADRTPILQLWLRVAGTVADGGDLPRGLTALRAAFKDFAAALRAATDVLSLDVDVALAQATAAGFLPLCQARVADWSARLPELREWISWSRVCREAGELRLEPMVAAIGGGSVAADAAEPVFQRSFREAWLHALMRREPDLARFRGLDHQRLIAAFRGLDQELIELASAVVRARLAAQLPAATDTGVASSELGILLRELKKQRRHLPVRQLFARIPHLLARLSPCLLMSPMSVAQYLGRRFPSFDLVVFDEASQIPVWDAVGAIGRGTATVVVGDSKQLPPTAFFQKLEGSDESFDEDELEELESVLDECTAAGLPRLYLRWHYRSRHESLIAFSNHHYYDNRLYTFPAAAAAGHGLGVELRAVNGVYDRGRSQTNRIEAEALVAEVVRRLRDPDLSRRSLGVVTFSMSQQTLVEDLLDQARREHPEIEGFFDAAREEPVFVKNLENVQGDERDVMLFSICYGPDLAGKVFMNFGPLNRLGGERRLNVAVTRARCELLVFSSLRAEQIDLARTQSLGARHLRAFLDYAERGVAAIAEAVAVDPAVDFESPFERAVGEALAARGHAVHRQVGCSGYRIDLAVVDPRAPGRHLLGIECDGASYHSAATARDRDRLRQAVLERLGWRLHRVWSTDWWQDPDGELRRIEEAIARCMARPVELRAAPPTPAPPGAAPTAADVQAVEPEPGAATGAEPDPDGPRPYVPAELPRAGSAEGFHAGRSTAQISAQIATVLEHEAPVVFGLLVTRIAASWDIGRVTERVRDRVRAVLARLDTAVTDDGAVLWGTVVDPRTFRGFRVPGAAPDSARDVDAIPRVELANALGLVLRQHIALGLEDLLREGARQFGVSRLGSNVRSAMEAALGDVVARGGAVVEDGRVRVGG